MNSTQPHPPALDATPEAPYGYTKAGKPRQRPAPNKEGICPVKQCKKSFRHRGNPKQAVWQHFNYYFRPDCVDPNSFLAKAHRAAHAQRKKESSSAFLTDSEKKEHKKEASRRFAQKNPEKRKQVAALANLKAKARRHLKRDGKEIANTEVNKMVEKWMEEKLKKNN